MHLSHPYYPHLRASFPDITQISTFSKLADKLEAAPETLDDIINREFHAILSGYKGARVGVFEFSRAVFDHARQTIEKLNDILNIYELKKPTIKTRNGKPVPAGNEISVNFAVPAAKRGQLGLKAFVIHYDRPESRDPKGTFLIYHPTDLAKFEKALGKLMPEKAAGVIKPSFSEAVDGLNESAPAAPFATMADPAPDPSANL